MRIFYKTLIHLSVLLSCLSINMTVELMQPLVRVKDVARIQGVRSNQLMGTGLVIGLSGTGDKTTLTQEMVTNTMKNLGLKFDANKIETKNAAAVIITAELPPFTSPGDTIDVTVSTMGDAKSLRGGILIQTPLRAADGRTYAVAQGALSLGGNIQQGMPNHQTVARMPGGASVEAEVPMDFIKNQSVYLALNNPDFTTANRVAEAINQTFGLGTSIAQNSSKIRIKIPFSFQNNPVEFISRLNSLQVIVDQKAKVVINERTGTVVLGGNVKISPVAIAHGTMIIEVGNKLNKSGSDERLIEVDKGGTVSELVNTLNLMGVNTPALIAILQEIKNSGALQASLEVL